MYLSHTHFTKILRLLAIVFILSAISLFVFSEKISAVAGINRQINFQGKLVNNPAKTNVSDTSYTVVFTIYDNSSGGTALWTEEQTVTTADGIFRVALGSVTAFPANFNFNWDGLYLGMRITAPVSNSEMTPRIQLTAVPYAFNAEKVAGLTVQDTSGNASTSGTFKMANAKTFTVNNTLGLSGTDGKTLTFNNSITLAGTDAKTLNIGANNLTFDTSAGDSSLVLPTSGTVCVNTNNCGYASGTNYWQTTSPGGAVTPINSTLDLLVGGDATTSAKFAVLNMTGSGTPTASVSAGTAGGAFLTAAGILQTTARQQLTLGGDTTGDITLNARNGLGTTSIVSDLSQGARTAGVLSIVQANNGSNNSSGNLLQLTNSDTGSTDAIIAISQVGGGTGINISSALGAGTAYRLSGSVTSGTAFYWEDASSLTSGSGLSLTGSKASAALPAFTGKQIKVDPSRDYQGSGVVTDTGNYVYVARSNTNSGAGTFNLTGDLATFSSNCTETSGTCVDTSSILSLTQLYSKASGAVLSINNSGVGSAAAILSNSGGQSALIINKTGNAGDIFTASSSGTTKFALDINGRFMLNPVSVPSYLSTLDVRPNSLNGGTISIASVSGATSFAGLLVDNTGVGDLFTASKSGATKFTILNNGNIQFAGTTSFLTTLATVTGNDVTLTIPDTGSTDTLCLATLANCGGGSSNWNVENGVITPKLSSTLDLLLGGTTTASAKFAVLNINTGTPAASVSSGLSGTSMYMTADGTLATQNRMSLTLGNSSTYNTTGNVLINPNGTGNVGIGTTNAGQRLVLGGSGVQTIGRDVADGSLLLAGGTGSGDGAYFQITGASYVGSPANGSAQFVVRTTGYFELMTYDGASSWTSRLKLAGSTGNIGIGTDNPLAALDIRGNSGITPVSSVSGATSFAGLVVDNNGVGDIFTASKSGATKFTILNNGNIQFAGTTSFLTTLATVTGNDVTLTIPDTGSTDTLCLATLANCGGGSSNWDVANGVITPKLSSTLDLLLGGTTTASAKFAVLNIDPGQAGIPTASVSSGLNGAGAFLTATGTLATTSKQQLTIGGADSGDLILKSRGQTVFKNPTIGTGQSTLVGELAGSSASLGDAAYATALGYGALRNNTTGVYNIAVGYEALLTNTIGHFNTAVGLQALYLNTRSGNTAQGFQALFSNTTGSYNTALGYQAGKTSEVGYANTIGTFNTFLGYNSGPGGINWLTNATAIGSYATVTCPNCLVLGSIEGINGATASARVGIGKASPLGVLDITGGNWGGNAALIVNQTGATTNDIFTASSSGSTKLVLSNPGRLGLGTTSPIGLLDISGTAGHNAAFILNQIGVNANDFIFAASQAGSTKFVINNSGFVGIGTKSLTDPLTIAQDVDAGFPTPYDPAQIRIIGVTDPNLELQLGFDTTDEYGYIRANKAGTGVRSLMLQPDGGSVGIGTVTPLAALDVNGTASVGGNFTLYGGTRSIQSTAMQTLTLGGSTTGNIVLTPNNGSGGRVTFTGAAINLGGSDGTGSQCLLGGAAAAWGSCGGGGSSNWTLSTANGTLSPINSTLDLLIGGTASNAAQFAILGVADGSSPVASLSATTGANIGQGLSFTSSNATIQSLIKGTLTIGGDTTGSIRFIPGGLTSPSLFLKSNGDIGIGPNNISPLASLDIRVNTANAGGTMAVASVSGKTSFAGLVVDNSGVGDIFTASSSGLTRFVIKQDGVVQIGNNTNGLTFDYINGGPLYSGSARPSKQIVLSPEFAGAILTASGSATTNGSMTSDASSSAALSNFRTYYEWSSTEAILQDYTVAVRVTLPQDFSDWNTTAGNAMHISFNTASTVVATNKLDAFIYNTDVALSAPGKPVVYQQAQVSASGKVWKTVDIDRADLIDSAEALDTAGETMIIYLKMYASGTYNYTQVGDIVLNYLSKF